MERIVIGTRASRLALWQAEYIRDLLAETGSVKNIEIRKFSTRGDENLKSPLPEIGDKGLFTRELEDALLSGDIHIAVHSLKDLPSELPAGLIYAASPKRADARDAFVSLKWKALAEVPENGIIATGSVRRQAQLLGGHPEFSFRGLRGNIETRLRKLKENGYDGIIMATAALHRLEMQDVITESLDPEVFVPSVGQGAVAVECLEDSQDILDILETINDPDTRSCCMAERAFMKQLEGGCSVALGAHAVFTSEGRLLLRGFVASRDGKNSLNDTLSGDAENPVKLGEDLAAAFLNRGAREILRN